MASAMEQLQGLGSVLSSFNSIFGGGGSKVRQENSGSTTTTGNDITAEGLQRIIDRMMAGPGGVKDISGAARGAGLYNSTTESQLKNDLAARVAGEAAARSATTTTTTGPSTTTQIAEQTGGVDPLTGLLSIGGMKLLGAGLDKGLNWLGDTLGFGASEAPALVGSIAQGGSLGLGQGISTGAFGLGLSLPSLGIGSSGLGSLGAFGSASSLFGDATQFGGFADAGSLAGMGGAPIMADTAGGMLSNLGNLPISAAANPLFSFASGLMGGEDSLNPFSMGMSSMGSGVALFPAMGPASLAVGPALQGLGSLFSGSSVICTALESLGLLDREEYEKGQAYIQTIHPWTIKGYYFWGVPVAEKIKRGSAWAISLCLPFAASRMHLLSASGRFTKYLRYPLGTVTQFIGQPLCFMLGALITFSEYFQGVYNGFRTR